MSFTVIAAGVIGGSGLAGILGVYLWGWLGERTDRRAPQMATVQQIGGQAEHRKAA